MYCPACKSTLIELNEEPKLLVCPKAKVSFPNVVSKLILNAIHDKDTSFKPVESPQEHSGIWCCVSCGDALKVNGKSLVCKSCGFRISAKLHYYMQNVVGHTSSF